MSLDVDESSPPLIIPEEHRRLRPLGLLAAVLVGAASLGAWASGWRPSRFWEAPSPPLATLEVDRGDVALVVTESGSLESADTAMVRCQVEALVGQVGGTTGGQGGRGGGAGGQSSQGGGQGSGGAGGSSSQGAASQPAPEPAQTKAKPKARTTATSSSASSATPASAGASTTSGTAPASGSSSSASASASGSSGGSSSNSTTLQRPDIRSFSYVVEPHVPLRPKTAAPAPAPKAVQAPVQQSGGGGGSRRGGNAQPEQPGSSRIISILPEGQRVKAGDIVCELDASTFRDELQAQKIRYVQAQSWVDQAKSILEVNEITLREYRDGIYPQDRQLIRQYIRTCETERERAFRGLEWSVETARKGFRAHAQVKVDMLSFQRAEIALREAEGMAVRLEKFTAPKIIKALEAKLEAIRADKLVQESAFQLESDRLKRLELMIAYCTLRAPRDGLVVYANQSNQWGKVEVQIQEGATVRQTMPIFYVPDPNRMRVKARINESMTGRIHSGQRALIRIDAFPDRPLRGTVAEITPIPAPGNRASPDVKVYYATVQIESGGFDALRPGMSAEIEFQVDAHRDVTRVPLQAIRWVGDQAFAALSMPSSPGTSWQWRAVTLGLSDSTHAEVLSGLNPGDRVVAHPGALATPRVKVSRAVAASTRHPQG